jgi:anaerobic ribonucleoside-triphosphate reductase activating protein
MAKNPRMSGLLRTVRQRGGPQQTDAVNVAHLVDRCRVLGPGDRYVIWVQGCPLRCPGCHNSDFLPLVDATRMTAEELESRIVAVDGIEGVTFVGGEPFAQARALGVLAQRVRRVGLTVMVYSGYTVEQLVSGVEPYAKWLLYSADLLLAGRCQQTFPTAKPWRDSDNQRLISLTSRYRGQIKEWNQPKEQDFEVRVRSAGTLGVLGLPPVGWQDDASGMDSGAKQRPGRRNRQD